MPSLARDEGDVSQVISENDAQRFVEIPRWAAIQLAHVLDCYGIIAARRRLNRDGIPIRIDRGVEWWM